MPEKNAFASLSSQYLKINLSDFESIRCMLVLRDS
jgi:hypothetical protein